MGGEAKRRNEEDDSVESSPLCSSSLSFVIYFISVAFFPPSLSPSLPPSLPQINPTRRHTIIYRQIKRVKRHGLTTLPSVFLEPDPSFFSSLLLSSLPSSIPLSLPTSSNKPYLASPPLLKAGQRRREARTQSSARPTLGLPYRASGDLPEHGLPRAGRGSSHSTLRREGGREGGGEGGLRNHCTLF